MPSTLTVSRAKELLNSYVYEDTNLHVNIWDYGSRSQRVEGEYPVNFIELGEDGVVEQMKSRNLPPQHER